MNLIIIFIIIVKLGFLKTDDRLACFVKQNYDDINKNFCILPEPVKYTECDPIQNVAEKLLANYIFDQNTCWYTKESACMQAFFYQKDTIAFMRKTNLLFENRRNGKFIYKKIFLF